MSTAHSNRASGQAAQDAQDAGAGNLCQADVIDRIAPIMLRITRRLASFALRPGVHAMDATSWYIVEHDGNPPSVPMRRR